MTTTTTFPGFTIEHEGRTYRYGVNRTNNGDGHFISYYPDGGVFLVDQHPDVTIVRGGPGTYGHTDAYYHGEILEVK